MFGDGAIFQADRQGDRTGCEEVTPACLEGKNCRRSG